MKRQFSHIIIIIIYTYKCISLGSALVCSFDFIQFWQSIERLVRREKINAIWKTTS